MSKKLEDWTLKEAQTYCQGRVCTENCLFFTGKSDDCCKIGHLRNPAFFDLTEEPAFTVAEIQFLEMLNNNGANCIARNKDKTLHWFVAHPKKYDAVWYPTNNESQSYGKLPCTMFSQVQWSDDSPLSIKELLSNGK